MPLQERTEARRGNIATARNGEVRAPGAQIGAEPGAKCGFLHALMQEEQLGMSGAHADPKDAHVPVRGKCPETDDRQEKLLETNGAKFFAQDVGRRGGNMAEETEGEMDLFRRQGP